jgi:hypothetical protein
MGTRTFGIIGLYDKLYKVSVKDSKLTENTDGSVIEALSVYSIMAMGDFYTIMLTLSDGSRIKTNRNNEVTCIENNTDGEDEHPLALNMDFYSPSRKALLTTVSARLQENITRMSKLKEEVLKISNTSITSKNIADSLCEMYKDEKPMTEVEFAEMALC